MTQVIKIKESDIQKIAENIINEQDTGIVSVGVDTSSVTKPKMVTNINPKGLKFGDGGRPGSPKYNDVVNLQRNLIKLGYLKTKSMKPTGYFGQMTQTALQNYIKKNNSYIKNSQSQNINVKSNKLKQILNKFNPLLFKKRLPLHIRLFSDFLKTKKTPVTKDYLTNEELLTISTMIKSVKGFKGGTFDFYNISNKLNDEKIQFTEKNLGLNQLKIKENTTRIALSLGVANVVDKGNFYLVTDTYDFNNFKRNPEKYKLSQMPKTVGNSIKKIFSGNYLQGLEQLAAYYEKFGYKGIPVQLEIPKQITA